MNMFCYGGNNPINTIDPSGHCFMFLTAAIGAVAGAVIGGAIAASQGKSVLKGALIGAAVGGLVGLGAGAAAGVLLAGTGVALIEDNLSRAASNAETVLYSGGSKAFEEASEFASETGGNVIDNTQIGQIASIAVKLPQADFTAVWSQASATFCNQASGVVNAFVSNSAYRGVDSIFWSVEMPTLLNNPRVTEVIIHIFE